MTKKSTWRSNPGGKAWEAAWGWPGTILSIGTGLLKYGLGGKDGGRVTHRGIGRAKRGFGKVLRKK